MVSNDPADDGPDEQADSPAPPAAGELPVGFRVGDYVVTGRVGSGATSVVYSGEEPRIKKRVAIKVLKEIVDPARRDVARVLREARLVNEVGHAGIVDVFAFGLLDDGRPYLVMSLLSGRSLGDELRARGRLPPKEAWVIARDIADALAAAHRAGIVHRDLKPDNVFLERHGEGVRPRLLDFGIAKADERPDELALSQTGRPMGTPLYMAPEQWWARGVEPRTDQYAFGVLLFELLTGRPPFAASTYVELLQAHLHEAPPTLASRAFNASAAHEALVERLLAKAPDARFESMAAVIAAGDRAFDAAGVASSSPAATTLAPETRGNERRAAAPTPAESAPFASAIAAPAFGFVAAPTARGAPRARSRAMVTLALGLGVVASAALGYAGPKAHSPAHWVHLSGLAGLLIEALVVVYALTALLGRGASGRVVATVLLALTIPSAHVNWSHVERFLATCELAERFAVLHVGAYEASAVRFAGGVGVALTAACVVWLGAQARAVRDVVSERKGRRDRWAAAIVPGALMILAASLGEWGVVFVASVALVLAGRPEERPVDTAGETAGEALATDHALPPATSAVASIAAVVMAFIASLARLSGREGFAWTDALTRSERAVALTSIGDARAITWGLGLAVITAALFGETMRYRRAAPAGPSRSARPRSATILAALLVATVASDAAYGLRVSAARRSVASALEGQFAFFAALGPPATHLPPELAPPPHAAAALQVSRDAVAVDGRRVARLDAIDTPAAQSAIANALCPAVAQRESQPPAPELSLLLDARTTAAVVGRLLALAAECGAGRVEMLLQKGEPPVLPRGAPPEAAFVIPSDFVAVRLRLSRVDGAPFHGGAEALARAAEGAVRAGSELAVRVGPPPAP